MNQPKYPRSFLFLLIILAFTTGSSVAQADTRQQLEPSYEVELQVLIGSNDAGPKSDLPQGLAGINRQLRSHFSFSNYKLANTFLGRVSNTGNIEYKSVSNIFGQETEADAQTFLEWSLNGLRSLPDANSKPWFQAQVFRFGARVPVRTGGVKDEGGKIVPSISYESIGLTINRIGLRENSPTLIGTLSLPKAGGTLFLVATIHPVDE